MLNFINFTWNDYFLLKEICNSVIINIFFKDANGNPVTQSVVGVTDSSGNPVTGRLWDKHFKF